MQIPDLKICTDALQWKWKRECVIQLQGVPIGPYLKRTVGQRFFKFPLQIFGRLVQVPQEALTPINSDSWAEPNFQSFSLILSEAFGEDLRFLPTWDYTFWIDIMGVSICLTSWKAFTVDSSTGLSF